MPEIHRRSVGILLCADKNERVVQYALGGASQAMAVSTYTYDTLPDEVRPTVPTPAQVIAAVEVPVQRAGRQITLDEYLAQLGEALGD